MNLIKTTDLQNENIVVNLDKIIFFYKSNVDENFTVVHFTIKEFLVINIESNNLYYILKNKQLKAKQ